MIKTKIQRAFTFGIRQKMILVLLVVLTVALTTTGWFNLKQHRERVLEETTKRGMDIASFLSEAVAFSVIGYDYHTMQLLLDKLVESQDVVYADVINASGNTMAKAGHTTADRAKMTRFDNDVLFDGQVIGQVNIGLDTTHIVQQVEAQKASMIRREILIVLLIALGEFLALSYIIVRPVSIISRSLDSGVDANGVSTAEIPLSSDDEFGRLASQFNKVRGQLSEANRRLQSKVDLADSQLRETNRQLMEQSEELRRMNGELRRLSVTDSLTGLYNRRQFEELMRNEVLLSHHHGDPNTLLVLDIDHFKKINDTYGHQAGDNVLRRLADILKDEVRRSDILCRVGGEEFVVFCKRVTPEDAMRVAEKLRRKVEETTFVVNSEHITVNISIGAASIPNDFGANTADVLFAQADEALYFSKHNGRNRVTHYAELAGNVKGMYVTDEKEDRRVH